MARLEELLCKLLKGIRIVDFLTVVQPGDGTNRERFRDDTLDSSSCLSCSLIIKAATMTLKNL